MRILTRRDTGLLTQWTFGTAGLDADAVAFLTAANITNTTQQNAIFTLVLNLKSFGLWTKCKAIYPIIGSTSTNQKYNLKDPRDLDAAYRLFFSGGWTHSDNGATPNGINSFANTFLNASIMTPNSEHISTYSRTTTITGLTEVGLITYTAGKISYVMIQHNTTNRYVANQGTDVLISATPTTGQGLTISNRVNVINVQRYLNNVKLELPNAGGGVGNLNYFLSAINGTGTFGTCQVAFASIGDGFTDTEATNFYNSVLAFQTTLGRNV